MGHEPSESMLESIQLKMELCQQQQAGATPWV